MVVLSSWNKTSTPTDSLFSPTDQQQPLTALETGLGVTPKRCEGINGSRELKEGGDKKNKKKNIDVTDPMTTGS